MSDRKIDMKVESYGPQELTDVLYSWDDMKYKLPVVGKRGEVPRFKGFRYFSPSHLNEHDCDIKFLIATESGVRFPDSIIGVIKTAVYNGCETLPDYRSTNYIDVREDRREIGVATGLIRSLNDHLQGERWLVGTNYVSELGQKHHLKEIIRRELHICPYFEDSSEFQVYLRQNNLMRSKS